MSKYQNLSLGPELDKMLAEACGWKDVRITDDPCSSVASPRPAMVVGKPPDGFPVDGQANYHGEHRWPSFASDTVLDYVRSKVELTMVIEIKSGGYEAVLIGNLDDGCRCSISIGIFSSHRLALSVVALVALDSRAALVE